MRRPPPLAPEMLRLSLAMRQPDAARRAYPHSRQLALRLAPRLAPRLALLTAGPCSTGQQARARLPALSPMRPLPERWLPLPVRRPRRLQLHRQGEAPLTLNRKASAPTDLMKSRQPAMGRMALRRANQAIRPSTAAMPRFRSKRSPPDRPKLRSPPVLKAESCRLPVLQIISQICIALLW
jgi:hypothetical protein